MTERTDPLEQKLFQIADSITLGELLRHDSSKHWAISAISNIAMNQPDSPMELSVAERLMLYSMTSINGLIDSNDGHDAYQRCRIEVEPNRSERARAQTDT